MRNPALFYILLWVFFLGSPSIYSQELKTFDPSKSVQKKPVKSKQSLATEYYAAGEFQKAIPLFEDLYKENSSSYFYRYLLYCYVQIEDYRQAEKMIKKAHKGNQKPYKELADLGYLQLKKGAIEKANKMFEEAIKELPANKAAVNELANDFRARGQTELAEKSYLRGVELLKGEDGFENELGYL